MRASVWVEIDLDEVSTRDLLDELENRYLSEWEQKILVGLLKEQDQQKFKLFLQVKNKLSVLELEELFKEQNTNAIIPKEQLQIQFNQP